VLYSDHETLPDLEERPDLEKLISLDVLLNDCCDCDSSNGLISCGCCQVRRVCFATVSKIQFRWAGHRGEGPAGKVEMRQFTRMVAVPTRI
jgi:hypothetical protein